MRQEQINHFKNEDCLKETSAYREFVHSALTGRDKVLDLGTGAGYGVLAIAEYVGKVIATDIEADMIIAAQKICAREKVSNVEFRQMSAEHIDFPDESLDAVQIRFSLHHFDNAQQVLLEVARVLKPDGILLLADAFFPQAVVQVWTITSLLGTGSGHPTSHIDNTWTCLVRPVFTSRRGRTILIDQSFDDFYNSAPENQRESLLAIVNHLTRTARANVYSRGKWTGKICLRWI